MPELLEDPRFETAAIRVRNSDAINEIVQQRLGAETWDHWSEKFSAFGVPVGQVRTLGEALRSPEARNRELTTVIPDPEAGWVPNVALPTKLSATPIADPKPAPRLGEHNDAVLTDVLGYNSDQIEALRNKGAFGA
jgi:crotonobetainyl-CoA:carnitine CoA-transferase CaiB-like acyl-CoA transferase